MFLVGEVCVVTRAPQAGLPDAGPLGWFHELPAVTTSDKTIIPKVGSFIDGKQHAIQSGARTRVTRPRRPDSNFLQYYANI